ncbi:hypothetical protein [Mycoplasma buteonis]|uniref:hypothetical protein n=1 Tax=Mycoplasma buteonis TaxID=171280 RepID=UPI000560C01F|nr:hypothetical protein [Mycoplasma buteonis]
MENNLSQPPLFTEEKLKEILHYTDLEANPSYDAFKSKEFYEIQSGAKGVSKSFGGAIISIYRLVNEPIFNSVWCRNQYNHIVNTIKPMFYKVLDFLKNEHGLDYNPYIKITNDAVYWNYDDGGMGRAIYFQNFEKTQAFQGITLPKSSFRFGELVIDEPIEDPVDSKKTAYELEQLYALQEEKLPLLLQNTVLRSLPPENFQIKVKFFYNIFTTSHFLIQNYHNKVIPLTNINGATNEEVLKDLINNKYIYKEDSKFDNDAGITVIMFSREFVPSSQMSPLQKKHLDSLKVKNYRLWVVTVAGFAYEDSNNKTNFFMRPILYDENGNLSKKIDVITYDDFYTLLNNGEVHSFWDGFDPGKSDNASWVRIAVLKTGEIILMEAIEDLKQIAKTDSRLSVNVTLINLIHQHNKKLKEKLKNSYQYEEDFLTNTILLTDNDIILESLNALARQYVLEGKSVMPPIMATKANRRDTKKEMFGIVSRQNWQKFIFENGLIKVIPSEGTKQLLKNLGYQVIEANEEKRNEKAYPWIYDLINAFEMSASWIYKYSLSMYKQKLKEGEQHE